MFEGERFVIHDLTDESTEATKTGPCALGSQVTITGLGTILVEDANLNVVPIVADPKPSGSVEPSYAWIHGAGHVHATWSAVVRDLSDAKREKKAEIEARYKQAFDLGVPATVTVGVTDHQIMVRLTEQDATRYALIETSAIPPDGVAIILTEPASLNGAARDHHMEKNVGRYTAVRVACQGHISMADNARFEAENAVDDATTVAAVDAIDVESYPWPVNTHSAG